jgi:Fe-S-cluster containining protein
MGSTNDPSPGPWYRDGLRFQCTQCGNCCTGAPGVVWVDEADIHAIAHYRNQTYGEILLHHTRLVDGRRSLTEFANGDCTFFDGASRRCTIYPVRPQQCQTWPFWRSNLASPSAWKDIQVDCPGAGHGDFVPLAEVERQAAIIDP